MNTPSHYLIEALRGEIFAEFKITGSSDSYLDVGDHVATMNDGVLVVRPVCRVRQHAQGKLYVAAILAIPEMIQLARHVQRHVASIDGVDPEPLRITERAREILSKLEAAGLQVEEGVEP